jgi:CHASE3 domain sensor protein
LTNTKRLGRYYRYFSTNNNDNSSSPSYFDELASLYKDNRRRSLLDSDKPFFGHKRTSLQKVLANANKAIEKSTKFINKIKTTRLCL